MAPGCKHVCGFCGGFVTDFYSAARHSGVVMKAPRSRCYSCAPTFTRPDMKTCFRLPVIPPCGARTPADRQEGKHAAHNPPKHGSGGLGAHASPGLRSIVLSTLQFPALPSGLRFSMFSRARWFEVVNTGSNGPA